MLPFLITIGVVLFILFVWLIGNYNRLASLRNHMAESWAGIEVELKRRYDLIPRLVNVCKGYASHERDVLEKVTALRNTAAASTGDAESQAVDEASLMREVRQLFAVVEAYPDLKADRQFLELQTELANTEDRIAAARRFYNANVRDMSNMCEMFPSKLVADFFGFRSQSYFELPSDAERVVPRVEF